MSAAKVQHFVPSSRRRMRLVCKNLLPMSKNFPTTYCPEKTQSLETPVGRASCGRTAHIGHCKHNAIFPLVDNLTSWTISWLLATMRAADRNIQVSATKTLCTIFRHLFKLPNPANGTDAISSRPRNQKDSTKEFPRIAQKYIYYT